MGNLTKLLVLLVLRPPVHWCLVPYRMDIHETRISKLLLVMERSIQGTPVNTESLVN